MEETVSGKVVILGDQGVGKTSLVRRYLDKEFERHVSPTIGASYFCCSVPVNNLTVKLQIWDTAGQERFKAMAPMFYRNANVAFLVFDITREQTFHNIQNWVTELNRNIDTHVMKIIIGCKYDLADKRMVTREDAIKYSHTIGATYYECSPLQNQGVDMIFEKAALALLNNIHITNTTRCATRDFQNPIDGSSSSYSATDIGDVILVGESKDNIAHGNTISNKCC